jgi:hypothetical protein
MRLAKGISSIPAQVISQNDHDIAEFHRSRKYSVRCVVVPTLDEVEIVKSCHFLAISSQATIWKQAETKPLWSLARSR